MNTKYESRKGFTLIELLVVVIIIAILAAIAVPQYKHAVLKSRFSTVMPMAKSIADAQEVYYQGQQMYALSTDELDVTPVSAEGASIALAPAEQEEHYAYVAASSADVPGARYIMYQKYSPRFAGTIQCEADATNEDALWLCEKGLSGTEIPGGSVNTAEGNYKTFLLAGDIGSDTFSGNDDPTGAGGASTTPTRQWDGNPPSCSSNDFGSTCIYNYVGGETLTDREYVYGKYEWLDQEGGRRAFVASGYSSARDGTIEGLSYTKMTDENGDTTIYFNTDGSIESLSLRTENGSVTFDGTGSLVGLYNYLGIPNVASQISYYPSGEIYSLFSDGKLYYYDLNGQATTSGAPIQDVSSYKLSSEELASYSTIAQTYVGQTKCEIYPELQECN